MHASSKLTTTHFLNDCIYYRPLIPLLMAFITGIGGANQIPGLIWPVIAGLVISAGFVLSAIFKRNNAAWSPLLLLFCLGYLALIPWQPTASAPPDHIRHYVGDSIKREISGIIDDTPIVNDFRTVCFLDRICLSDTEPGTARIPVRGKIRTVIYGKRTDLASGDRLTFTAALKPFTNFENPGGFDYMKYMSFRQVWGNAYTSAKKIDIQPPPNTLFTELSSVRLHISTLIDQASDGDSNAILNALVLGNRQQISNPLREAFNRAGISHLLAISGLHIGIVASFSFFLFTGILSQIPAVLRHAWTRKGAALLSMLPVLIYGTLAGMSPSTQRAVIMICVFLMTFLMEREHDLINTVAVAALMILVLNPPSLFSVSFQLSFAAVLSIISGLSRGANSLARPDRLRSRPVNTLLSFLSVSVLAIIGTAPLTMYYFNQISPAGLFSNLIFIPLIGFAVVPVGLFSVLVLLPLWADAAGWGLKLCDSILGFAIKWIYWIADLPCSALKTITPSVIELVCSYVLIACALYLLFPKAGPPRDNNTPHNDPDPFDTPQKSSRIKPHRARKLPALPSVASFAKVLKNPAPDSPRVFVLLVSVLVILSADIVYWVDQRWWKKDLTVSVIDVGQGNAALIEMPGGTCALIDGGGYSGNSAFDMGERVIAPFLWRKKIHTIESVFLTHYDADHMNGLIYILNHFNVQQVFANHDPLTRLKNTDFVSVIDQKNIDYPSYESFSKTIETSGVVFNILYPSEHFADDAVKDVWRSSNNNSMVIQVIYKNQAILFPGDIMKEAEDVIVKRDVKLASDILIAPHHGSSSSSTPAFINKVNPEYVIVSSGKQNRFGFPSPVVLEYYMRNQIKVFRTDINGSVCIECDGKDLRLAPQKGLAITSIPENVR